MHAETTLENLVASWKEAEELSDDERDALSTPTKIPAALRPRIEDVKNITIVKDALITFRNLARGGKCTKAVFKDAAYGRRQESAMRYMARDAALTPAHGIHPWHEFFAVQRNR